MKPLQHRNLFNGDSSFLFTEGYLLDKGRYTVEVLHRFIDLLAASGVDTYLQSPNASTPWYPSRVLPWILSGYTRGDRDFVRGHFGARADDSFGLDSLEAALDRETAMLDRLLDLHEDGVDWLAEITAHCRRRGLSPWSSIRMNDMHGAQGKDSYMDCALRKNPRFCLSGHDVDSRNAVNPYRMGLEYSHPEVRDYQFALIREVVNDYAFEGLELDWSRCAFCCEPPASPATIDTMTQWLAQIRALTDARAAQIGKPYPLGMRVPSRVEQLREIGLDLRVLAREGLLDFIGPCNFWQTTWDLPYDQMRSMVGDDVAIYGMIDDAPNWLPVRTRDSEEAFYRMLSASAEMVRANAAGKLASGADGIETYNYFCTDDVGFMPTATRHLADYAALRGLDDLENLRGKPKHYALASAATRAGNLMWPEWDYAEQLPCVLEPECRRSFRFAMCAEPETTRELRVQVVVEKRSEPPRLAVSFNGSWPSLECEATDELLFPTGHHTHHVAENEAYNFRCDAARIRDGWNEVTLANTCDRWGTIEERTKYSVRIVSVELAVEGGE